jgi:hypothetical protein
MSVRTRRSDQPVVVRRGPALHTAEHVKQYLGVEFDVFDSRGNWFGTAVDTAGGAYFMRPPELNGVRVLPPFQVSAQPNSAVLANALGAALSHALSSPG